MQRDLLTRSLLGASICWGLLACAEPGDDAGDEGPPETSSGDGDGDSGDGDGDGEPGDGDGEPGDGDGDGGPGDGDGEPGDGDGDPHECAPADPEVSFSYEPIVFNMFDPWSTDIDWACLISEVDVSDGLYLVLDCPDAPAPVTLNIKASPTFVSPAFVGETINMRYVSEGPWWFNVYLRLDMEGYGHLLTLIDGDSLRPPETFEFELPFDFEPQYGVCATAPDGCGDRERLVLGFDAHGEPTEMIDGSYGIVGGDPGTEVWVAAAGHLHDIQCTDTPDEWYRVLIADTGWE